MKRVLLIASALSVACGAAWAQSRSAADGIAEYRKMLEDWDVEDSSTTFAVDASREVHAEKGIAGVGNRIDQTRDQEVAIRQHRPVLAANGKDRGVVCTSCESTQPVAVETRRDDE
jgi:hypothetical protein